jgi:hypothetical protein
MRSPCRLQQRLATWNTGADHNCIDASWKHVRLSAEMELDPWVICQVAEVQILGRPAIHADHRNCPGPQQAGRALAGDSEAIDQGTIPLFGFQAHLYLNFNVARPISANMIDRIQKRTMILGSAQPLNSKW